MKKGGSSFVVRVRVLTILFVVVAVIIVARLYMLQIMQGHAYTMRANAQFIEPASTLLDRGNIFFTNKDGTQITAATVKEGFSLAINPTKVKDPEAVYAAINYPGTSDQARTLARMIHEGSLRTRADAKRDGHSEG